MRPIRLFLYLDEYRMYSVSSQIFEGLSDYVVRQVARTKTTEEDQKGPVGSGRVVADIATEQTKTEERRFLHDYAYTLVEEKLIEEGRVLTVERGGAMPSVDDLAKAGFVKVSGPAFFNDLRAVAEMSKKFNQVGEALAYVSTRDEREKAAEVARAQVDQLRDRNEIAKARAALKELLKPEAVAQAKGLQQDKVFLEKLTYLVENVIGDDFELRVIPGKEEDLVFTGLLKREQLREGERLLIKEYSRRTQQSITLFGSVAQIGARKATSDSAKVAPPTVREAILQSVLALGGMEEAFFGLSEREIVLEPIAVYRELS